MIFTKKIRTRNGFQRCMGFTLSETLATLLVLGVLAAILIPIVNKLFPNETEIMHKKATSTVSNAIASIINNDTFYPLANGTNGFSDTQTVTYNGKSYGGGTKLCSLFGVMLNTSSVDCSASGWNVKTNDGMVWDLSKADFLTSKQGIIKVDVSGGVDVVTKTSPNCTYDIISCRNPDQFVFYVKNDGRISLDPFCTTTIQCSEYNPVCTLWNQVCTEYDSTVCTEYNQDLCTSYNQVCNSYNQVCDSYNQVCTSYNQVCSEYNQVCSAYNQVCSEYNQSCSDSTTCATYGSESYICSTDAACAAACPTVAQCKSSSCSNLRSCASCPTDTGANGFCASQCMSICEGQCGAATAACMGKTMSRSVCSAYVQTCVNTSCKTYTNGSCSAYTNGSCKTYTNGSCNSYTNGSCNSYSNGSCNSYSNGSCATWGNGTCKTHPCKTWGNGTTCLATGNGTCKTPVTVETCK